MLASFSCVLSYLLIVSPPRSMGHGATTMAGITQPDQSDKEAMTKDLFSLIGAVPVAGKRPSKGIDSVTEIKEEIRLDILQRLTR
jgi:hypothetical protein